MNEIKEIWKEIYNVAEKLEIGRDRLNTLVTEILGKRADTEEEAKEVLRFLHAVEKKLHTTFLTTEQAIDVVKVEGIEEEPIGEESGEGVEAKVEVVEPEEKKEEEEKWDKTVKTEDGEFMFRQEGEDRLVCKNAETGEIHIINPTKPECSCPDFQINKRGNEMCKHLMAALEAGYDVAKLPEMPEEVTTALAKPKKVTRGKAKKGEEIISVKVLDKQVELGVQVPTEIITNEDRAVEIIKTILGTDPKKEDVIASYAGIEELNASVVLSLASYIGIRHVPVAIEEEKKRINIGEVFLAVADEEKRNKYEPIVRLMGEVEVTTRCRVISIAGWRDKNGNVRIGIGTKEEFLTPHDLADIARRGASFIRTKAETKSAKKAIINVLPVTAEGLLRKICRIYHWEL